MKKKGQVLAVALTILVVLSVMALSIGNSVALALKTGLLEKDRAKLYFSAKAGINRAIFELKKDANTNAYDWLQESWAGDPTIFEHIAINPTDGVSSRVSYIFDDGYTKTEIFGARDEESKININTVDQKLIEWLLFKVGEPNYVELAQNICIWRGSLALVDPAMYASKGYPNKGKPFSTLEELILVNGMSKATLDKIRNLVTVYGSGQININTVDGKISINTMNETLLDILIGYCIEKVKQSGIAISISPQNLSEKIMTARANAIIANTPFTDKNNLATDLLVAGQTDYENAITQLKPLIDVKSSSFRIISTATTEKTGRTGSIECVYDRANNKITAWHEVF